MPEVTYTHLHEALPKPVIVLAFANDRMDQEQYLRSLPDERRDILSALKPVEQNLCEIVNLPNATVGEIFDVFQDARYRDRIAVFHYGGHANAWQLLLEDTGWQNRPANSAGLITLLKNQKGLKLVFLNGCCTEPQAKQMIDSGIPIVVGTTKSVQDETARQLAVQFYQALGQGYPIGRAWEEAEAFIQMDSDGPVRKFGRDVSGWEHFPWVMQVKEGSVIDTEWSLSLGANDPLFGLPPLTGYDKLPDAPFQFLGRYQEDAAPVFFGRAIDIRKLYDRMTDSSSAPVVLLSGQSGVGKSSLIEAGLLPRLNADHLTVYLRRDSVQGLTMTLAQGLATYNKGQYDLDDLPGLWKRIEANNNKPLMVLLDQTEEALTQPLKEGAEEFLVFFNHLYQIFSSKSQRPMGKLLLSMRSEYATEISYWLEQCRVPRQPVVLQPLAKENINEIVNGLASTSALKKHYRIGEIQSGLAAQIAHDLSKDPTAPIAPVLSIIMTKLWKEQQPRAERRFLLNDYLKIEKEGIFLSEFFEQQILQLKTLEEQLNSDIESSGLALDVLYHHTTELGTARSIAFAELQEQYQHRADVIEELIRKLKELYLLTDEFEKPNLNRLAHDTLAPIVLREFKNSERPGQRALRILTNKTGQIKKPAIQKEESTSRESQPSKASNAPEPEEILLDAKDLVLVEKGHPGMRYWTVEEASLIQRSRKTRKRARLQWGLMTSGLLLLGLFAGRFGYVAFQKSRLERLVTQARLEAGADATVALQTIRKALALAPENPAATAAFADIYSENEFYEQSFQHPGPVKGVFLAPGGDLFSYTEDALFHWARNGQLMKKEELPDISAVALSPDGATLIVASVNGNLFQFDAQRLAQKMEKTGLHSDQVDHLAFSADGLRLFTSGRDSLVQILNPTTLTPLLPAFKCVYSGEIPTSLTPSSHSTLFFGFSGGTVQERNLSGTVLTSWAGHTDQVLSIALAPGDSAFASAGRDAIVNFTGKNSTANWRLKAHERRINAVLFSPDGQRLFTAGTETGIKCWSPAGDLITVYRGHTNAVNALSLSKDGQYMASASDDGMVRLWKIESKIKMSVGPHPSGVSSVAISADAQVVVTGVEAGLSAFSETFNDSGLNDDTWLQLLLEPEQFPRSACLWSLESGKQILELKSHRGGINAVAFQPAGANILTASDDSTAILWNKSGLPVVTFRGHRDAIAAAVFSPDGKRLLTGGRDSLAVLWDANGSILQRLEHPGIVSAVAWAPSGSYFATGCYDGTVRIFDSNGVLQRQVHPGGSTRILSLAFSPGGQTILAGGLNNLAYLYGIPGDSIETIKVAGENKTGGAAVRAVAFSPNGQLVCLGAEGGVAQVFRLPENGQALRWMTLRHYPKRAILSVVFAPDGNGVLTGCGDGWVRWWKW